MKRFLSFAHRLWTVQGKLLVHDVWPKKSAADTPTPYIAHLDSHDVVLFRLTPGKK